MAATGKIRFVILTLFLVGCNSNSALSPQKVETNAAKQNVQDEPKEKWVEGREIRHEYSLERSRRQKVDELGLLKEIEITYTDGSKVNCIFNQLKEFVEATEVSSVGGKIHYSFVQAGNNKVLREQFFRNDGSLEAVRDSDPNNQRISGGMTRGGMLIAYSTTLLEQVEDIKLEYQYEFLSEVTVLRTDGTKHYTQNWLTVKRRKYLESIQEFAADGNILVRNVDCYSQPYPFGKLFGTPAPKEIN